MDIQNLLNEQNEYYNKIKELRNKLMYNLYIENKGKLINGGNIKLENEKIILDKPVNKKKQKIYYDSLKKGFLTIKDAYELMK